MRFYEVVDNKCKLGYGGTKTEMERLVKDAAKLDKSIDANSLSYGNIVKAIHAVQENMGVTGTTAKEAEKTITGSLNAMKSSWGNLLTAMASGENIDQCMDNMVSSVEIFAGNVMPVVERGLVGLGTVVEKIAPIIAEKLPALAEKLLPPLIQAAVTLVKGLIKALPDIIGTLGKSIVDIFGEQFPVLKKIGESLSKNAKSIAKFIPAILGLVGALMAFKKIKAIGSVFSGLFGKSKGGGSGSSGGIFSGLSSLAKTNTKTILKGIANIGLILVAMGALLYIANKVFASGVDFVEMLKVTVLIGILGAVGSGLAKLAGIVGKIPIMTVVKGLANIAIVLAGMGALLWAATKIFKDGINFTEMTKVIVLIGMLGTVGSILAIFAGIVGMLPIAIVLKGIANIGLTIVALGALLWTATKVFSDGVDFVSMLKVITLIGILGTVGTILSVFAGIVGMIPIPVVLAGLANMALVLGGITALIVAFGKMTEIPGFAEFVEKGGEILAKVFNAIGKMAGSLIGGLGEGITNSLPKIGENIAKFAESIKPMFTVFQGVDMSGIGAFFGALGGFLLQLAGDKILSFFTGGPDLAGLGNKLNDFATNAQGFFNTVATYPENGFTNGTKLFECLSGLGNLPNSGGIVGWFSGEVDYSKIATGLGSLANEGVKNFFTFVAGLKQEAFDNATKLFECLNGIGNLPSSGGIVQWFKGEVDYAAIATGLGLLAGASVVNFFNTVSGLKQEAFDNATKLFNCLNGIGNLPNSGGIVQWFTGTVNYEEIANGLGALSAKGVENFFKMAESLSPQAFENTTALFNSLSSIDKLPDDGGAWGWLTGKGDETDNLTKLGEGLGKFAENAQGFFDQVNNVNLNNLNGLWDSLNRPGEITANSLKSVSEHIAEIVEKVTKLPQQMGDGIKSAGHSLAESLVYIWKEAAKAMATPVNKIIEGANWILGEFGSDKKIASWTPYARGTSGHKGGNALVNDGRGAELVQMPNGRTFIPQGRNVFLPFAPKGMKVLPAEQTARLMGRKSPTFRYAKGTGDIDLWNYIDDSKGLVNAVSDKYVSYDGMSGYALAAGKGMVGMIKGAMESWTKKLFDEFGAKSLADYVASAGVEQWRSTVIRALKMENQYSAANVERTLYQMQTESGGNPKAINLWDSNAKAGIPSKGLMQVIDPTFQAYARAGFNSNIYDPLSNILASIRYAVSRYGSLGKAYQGHGYAKGVGTVDLSAYTPESSSSTVINSRNKETIENNSYSPIFNLTISGTTDDRVMARKVQRWVKEALNEAYESMNRKNPATIKI